MKKNYVVAVKSPENWEVVHELLTQDGTLEDNIPTRACECTNIKPYSTTRSTYLLDNDEVELLKSNENIIAVHIDEYFHPEEAPPKPKYSLKEVPAYPILKNRFGNNVFNIRDPQFISASYDIKNPTPGVNNLNRTGYQLLRLTEQNDPWEGEYTNTAPSLTANYDGTQDYGTTTIVASDIQYYDDGEGIDVIISDDGCWLAHPEFVENDISQVRDVVLDGPYYLDPAAFEPEGPLAGQTETYIGRTTCTEAAAKAWWQDSNNRSTTELQEIGGVPITPEYTRQKLNGSTSLPMEDYRNHGTACASQAYGKSLGWAFKANKWFIASASVLGDVPHWDIINIFHRYKPDNETHGDKNPLVISTSWGLSGIINTDPDTVKYINYRGNVSSFQSNSDMPNCGKSLSAYSVGRSSQPKYEKNLPDDHPAILAGSDVAKLSRVFLFNATGNSTQKITYPGHPDYDNWWRAGSNEAPSDPGFYFNRIGYPGQISLNADSPNGYLTFSIGALMQSVKDEGGVKKEQRADYSNMGPGVDIYAPANRSLAALNNPNELFLFSGVANYYPIGRYDSPGSTDYLTLPDGGVGAFGDLLSENSVEGEGGFFDNISDPSYNYLSYLPLTITDSNPPTGGSAFTVEIYINPTYGAPMIKITEPGSGYSVGDVRTITNAGSSGRNIKFTVTHLLAPYDNSFGGTSSACPVAAGFYACFLQRRRNWNALKLKRYIHDILPEQDSNKFYLGTEATTANDASFNDFSSLQGGAAKIPYILEPPSILIDTQPQSAQVNEGTVVNFQVVAATDPLVGTLSYQWEVSSDEGATWSDIPGEQSDTYSTTAQISNNNSRYRVMLSGTGGYDDTYSDVAILTLNQQYSPNNAPTDIILSNISLDENTTKDSTVATISAVDADPEDTHVFFLTPGYGDNAKFYIDGGNQLKISNNSDQTSYDIKIETYDSGAAYPIAIREDGYAVAKWGYTYQGATSMASPQVTGVLACLLEHYPRMSQQDCRDWVINNAKLDQIGGETADKSDIDWTDQRSLFGAENRYLYYKKQRETEGYVTAQLTNNVRKSSGMVFPRKRHI